MKSCQMAKASRRSNLPFVFVITLFIHAARCCSLKIIPMPFQLITNTYF